MLGTISHHRSDHAADRRPAELALRQRLGQRTQIAGTFSSSDNTRAILLFSFPDAYSNCDIAIQHELRRLVTDRHAAGAQLFMNLKAA